MNTHYLKKFRRKANKLLSIVEEDDRTYMILFSETGCCFAGGMKTMQEALRALNVNKRFYIKMLCERERAFREHSIFY